MRILVACQVEEGYIVARCRYHEQINQWLFGAGFRFDALKKGFKTLASSSVARVLQRCSLEDAHIEVSEEIRAMALISSESAIDFVTQPPMRRMDGWRHQVGAFNFANSRDAALFQMRMGTGKSKPTVELIENSNFRKTLILCPSKVLGVWRRELDRWSVNPPEVLVLDKKSWNARRQAEESANFLKLAQARGNRAVIVQNYESAIRPDFQKFALSQLWDSSICDESHRLKSATKSTSKFAGRLGRRAGHRLCLSGTSLSHSPLDVFGQARHLDPRFFGDSWAQFRNRFAVSGPFGADHIVSYKNLDELSEIMGSFSYSVGDEVLDLPEFHHIDLQCDLDSKTLRIYQELEQEFCAQVDAGVITVANGLVKLLRLQQITSGYLPLEDGGIAELNRCKSELLNEWLQDIDSGEPVVVFCRYKEDLARVQQIAEKTGRRYGEISGSRCDLTSLATMPEDIDLMGVQIQSGGVGIDLTRARYAVYYSVGYSLSDFDQSIARVKRPGQTRPMTFVHLVAKATVDETIYKALQKRRDLIDAVLERLKNRGD